jgi:hypothetical protein
VIGAFIGHPGCHPFGGDSARDKVGHAIRRVIEEKKRIKKSRDVTKELKAQASRRHASGDDDDDDDDCKSINPSRGKKLPSLDDFIESEVDVFDDGPASSQEPTIKGITPTSKKLSSSLIMPHKWEGVVVPSFLSQGMFAGTAANISQSSNAHGAAQLTTHSSFSMDQPTFSRPDIAYLQSTQQQQSSNEASLLDVLSQTASRPGLEGWMSTPLLSMQQLGTGAMQQHQDQVLPRTSVSVSTTAGPFELCGDLQQARLAALLEEQQQKLNNQLLLQNRLPFTGDPGLAGVNTSNNPGFGSFGLPPLSTSAMGSGGYAMTGATPNFSTFASGNMGNMVLPSTYTMDSSLTSTQGFASLNDLSFVQNQQMQQLQMQQLLNSTNTTNQGMDGNNNNSNNNNNFSNYSNQTQFQ